jgi:SCF-associated factor 1
MASLARLPLDIYYDQLLPLLPLDSLIHLSETCKAFDQLVNREPASESLWRHRIETDLNFPADSTARTSGWKELYRRVRNPRIYVWGCVVFSLSFRPCCR